MASRGAVTYGDRDTTPLGDFIMFGLLPILLASGTALAGTPVCGTIAASTTWTAGTYTITCDTTVVAGATLAVDPGVLVEVMPGVNLYVQGELDVNGTMTQPVTFQRAVPASPWGGIQLRTNVGGHAVIDWATIDGAQVGISVECCNGHPVPADLFHVTLTNHTTALGGYAGHDVLVDQSEIAFNGVGVATADKTVTNTWIHDNTYGVAQSAGGGYAERMLLEGCLIQDNTQTGVWMSNSSELRYSTVTGSPIGVYANTGKVSYNDIQGNGVGVRTTGSGPNLLSFNNLDGNTTFALEHLGGGTVLAGNNWWGTTAPAVIDTLIWDVLDSVTLGLVDYSTPALAPVLTTYSPPTITGLTWDWSTTTSLGVDLSCPATDDGVVVSVAWTITDGSSTWTATTGGPTYSWVAPTDGVYDVQCRVTDDTGLHDRSDVVSLWVAADSDLDGVVDDWDLCPGTPPGSGVDADGCVAPPTCVDATYAAGTLTIPAVWMPSGACISATLVGPPSALTPVSSGACLDACAPAAYDAASQLLVLPEVWVGAQDWTAVLQWNAGSFGVLSATSH